MFKSARWRSEKGKIKAVFKLQFRATQVAGDALMISVVPADVGKPTVKSEKAAIRDGSCCWENAVYETVKLYREPKSGKIHERIYNFVVGTGSSKSGVVGEASIDFSSYADATKVSSVSLPLKNSRSGAILHVSIQRIHDSFDQSIIQENGTAKPDPEDRTLKAQISNEDMEASFRENSVDEAQAPVNKNISLVGTLNGRRASSESDITLSSCESSSGLDTPRELQTKNSNTCKDQTVGVPAIEEHQRSRWEWMGGSTLDGSTDDSSSTSREANLRGSEEIPDDVEKLRSELIALARQAEVSELELQTLRKQIVKESKRGQDLSREIVNLKEERDAFKEECEKLKASQRRLDDAKSKDKLLDRGDVQALVHELRQELNYQKDLNANLQIQLEKTQESNSELILAVRDLDEMLEQKNKEIMNLSGKSEISDDAEKLQDANLKQDNNNDDDDDEQKALEQLVQQHSDIKEAYLLEQKIMDLQNELEIYRRDKDELEMQMEQLALDYEILKQENHDLLYRVEQSQLQEQLKMQYECSTSYATVSELEAQIEGLENELKTQSATVGELEAQIEGLENELKTRSATVSELEAQIEGLESELKKQSKEFSDSLLTISSLESQVNSLEEELEKQAQGFEADLEALSHDKVEQEQRAIRAEEALRKTRWQNANTAERLQEEFKRLSMQMTSSFEANEKLAIKAMTEANELRLHKSHLEEMLQKSSEELQSEREHYEARLHELSSQVNMMSGQIKLMQSEIEEKSTLLENEKKHAEGTQEHLSKEMLLAKAEIEKLLESNKVLSEHANKKGSLINELEEMSKTIVGMELMLEQGNKERSDLENRLALMHKRVEESLNELNNMRHLKDEKDALVGELQLEMGTLRTQYNELNTRLSEDELEKDKLRKQVAQLKGDLKKKEDALNSVDKKPKDANNRLMSTNGTRAASKNNKFASATQGLKEVNSLKEKIKLLEGQIKLKENALETSTNSFLEKEKDLQNKIEELETTLVQLNQNTASICEQKSQKVATEDLNLNSGVIETVNSSNNGLLEEEIRVSASSTRDMDKLWSEVTLLRERNTLMEDELKDMQERYSEISLKFAEVEGERQQLVMKVRNLKNAKKGH